MTVLLLAGVTLPVASAAAQAPPLARRPGWWHLDVHTALGAAGLTHQSVHICTDPAVDRVQTPFGVHMGAGCPPVLTTQADGGWDVSASCKVGATTMSVQGRLVGDLASAYHVDLVTRFDPPLQPQAAEVKIGMDARWLGACPAGKSPGDVDLSMNVAPGAAPPGR